MQIYKIQRLPAHCLGHLHQLEESCWLCKKPWLTSQSDSYCSFSSLRLQLPGPYQAESRSRRPHKVVHRAARADLDAPTRCVASVLRGIIRSQAVFKMRAHSTGRLCCAAAAQPLPPGLPAYVDWVEAGKVTPPKVNTGQVNCIGQKWGMGWCVCLVLPGTVVPGRRRHAGGGTLSV